MPIDASTRRRRRGGCLVTIALLVLGLVLGVWGIDRHLVPALTPEMCTVEIGDQSTTLAPEQAENAATIAAVGVRRGLPQRAVTIALATALQESKLRNLDHGDRDSLGLFQQRPSQGWGTPAQLRDPVYATEAFYDHLVRVRDYRDLPLTVVAQKVQRSGFPDAYARHEERATLLSTAFTGREPAAVTCSLDDPEARSSTADIRAALEAQLGVSPAASGDRVTGVVASPQLAWATASWAVAHADSTGITEVTVADRTWSRGHTARATRWVTGPDTGARSVTISTTH